MGFLVSGIRNPASSFEDIQGLGLLNRLTALVDLKLPVDVLQVAETYLTYSYNLL
jgi:hypothetical protein